MYVKICLRGVTGPTCARFFEGYIYGSDDFHLENFLLEMDQ
jgi:hypothetical protein